jgi:hypothetical protein
MKNYIAPTTIYQNEEGKVKFDLYDCFLEKEYNHNQKHPYKMDNVYLVPTKEALKKYGGKNLDVVILKGLSEPQPSTNPRFKGGWNYKASHAKKVSYLEFIEMVGGIPRFYSGCPIATGWNAFEKIVVADNILENA